MGAQVHEHTEYLHPVVTQRAAECATLLRFSSAASVLSRPDALAGASQALPFSLQAAAEPMASASPLHRFSLDSRSPLEALAEEEAAEQRRV